MKLLNKISNKIRYKSYKLRSCLGTMEKYYKISEKYGKKIYATDDIKQKKYFRKKIVNYARYVEGPPFFKEKEEEKHEIWDAIKNDRLPDTYAKEALWIKKHNRLELFPYDFCEKYTGLEVKVFSDAAEGNCYVLHNGKKLYFPLAGEEEVKKQYRQLVMEQDIESPHRYYTDGVPECDVFIDIGGAEGIISLDALDKAKEIYILECSKEWIKALSCTFKDYTEKVHVVNKFAGEYVDKETITIDSLLNGCKGKNIVIKMDIEGMEIDALYGCKETMRNNNCVFACASYHTNNAYEEISSFFRQQGYNHEASDNYMLFLYGYMTLCNGKYTKMKSPYFRHGIVRASNEFLF